MLCSNHVPIEKQILKKKRFWKRFLTWWIVQILEKPWKMWKKNREANLAAIERRRSYLVSEPKFHITLIIIKLISDRNEKNWNTYEQNCLFRTFNTRVKQDINVWVLVWLPKTKILRKALYISLHTWKQMLFIKTL